jgi:hypothetical protein
VHPLEVAHVYFELEDGSFQEMQKSFCGMNEDPFRIPIDPTKKLKLTLIDTTS